MGDHPLFNLLWKDELLRVKLINVLVKIDVMSYLLVEEHSFYFHKFKMFLYENIKNTPTKKLANVVVLCCKY